MITIKAVYDDLAGKGCHWLSRRDGADYCEITACHCERPWEHCDSGPDPRDWEGYRQG